MTVQSDIETAFATVVEKFGRVDVVINNAGYTVVGPFEDISDKLVRELMEVNFFGVLNMTRKAVEIMRGQKKGGLVQQITSIGAQIG